MEVEFNSGLNANTGASQTVPRQKILPPSDNTMSIGRTQALEQALQMTPSIRPEAVTRASALVADDNYPPDEVLDRVASHLAGSIGGQTE